MDHVFPPSFLIQLHLKGNKEPMPEGACLAFPGGGRPGFPKQMVCKFHHHLPSGKHTNYGKIHHFQWENPLFLWSFSIAMLNYQRVSRGRFQALASGFPTLFFGEKNAPTTCWKPKTQLLDAGQQDAVDGSHALGQTADGEGDNQNLQD